MILLEDIDQWHSIQRCDSAIEDIVNEAIVSDTNDSPITIELSNLNASDGIKKKIREEFKHICDF